MKELNLKELRKKYPGIKSTSVKGFKAQIPKPKGVGDVIEKFTKATGIKTIVDKVTELTGWDCGCEENKIKLNKIFPFADCLTETEYNYLKDWFDSGKTDIDYHRRLEFIKIYNRVLSRNHKDTSCQTCIIQINNDLKRIYNEYSR